MARRDTPTLGSHSRVRLALAVAAGLGLSLSHSVGPAEAEVRDAPDPGAARALSQDGSAVRSRLAQAAAIYAVEPGPNSLIDARLEPAPEEFERTDEAVWDGRRTLQGIWVAHPEAETARRVRIINRDTGYAVDGALFRRDGGAASPSVLVSSDAAVTLGMEPGEAATLSIVAIRRAPPSPGAVPQRAATAGAAEEADPPAQERPAVENAAAVAAALAALSAETADGADGADGGDATKTGTVDAGDAAAELSGAWEDAVRPDGGGEAPGETAAPADPAGGGSDTAPARAIVPTEDAQAGSGALDERPVPAPVARPSVPARGAATALADGDWPMLADVETGSASPVSRAADAADADGAASDPSEDASGADTVAAASDASGAGDPVAAADDGRVALRSDPSTEAAVSAAATPEPSAPDLSAQAPAAAAVPDPAPDTTPGPAPDTAAGTDPEAPAPASDPEPPAAEAASEPAPARPAAARTASTQPDRPFIQSGIFGVEANARRLIETLRAAGYETEGKTFTSGERTLTRVVSGPFESDEALSRALAEIRRIGPSDAVPVRR